MTPEVNKVLANATAAIDALGAQGTMTAPELAAALDMPRPSAYRLLNALVHAGFAQQRDDGTVGLSPRWLRLGDSAVQGMSSWFRSDEALERLRDETGLTVFLGIPRDEEVVCVRRLHGQNFQVLVLKPGGTLPLYLGAVGRTMLAFGDVEIDRYLADAPFEPVTADTLVTADALRADIATSRRMGYCLSDQDVTVGVGALGVPVWDSAGRAIAALSIAGIREHVVEDQKRLAERLHETAAQILGESA
jgi:IclR family acetate operon transcriptional repressor